MKLRLLSALIAVLLLPVAWAVPSLDNPALSTEPEQFQVTQKTEVPNVTLQPGSYSIRVLDHLRDRVILQVSGNGRVETTFIAIPASTMANAPVGPIPYSTGPKGQAALKGFAFPGGLAVEFVYPKNDAVSIATANDTRVMAIDPASEGRVAAPKLSQNDMQMITLWMLEPSRVGPNDTKPTGIAATKYQAPPQAESSPVETAQTETAPPANPAGSPASVNSGMATDAGTHRARAHNGSGSGTHGVQAPVQLARNDTPAPPPARTHTRPANVTALPHTASALPLLWLAMLGSLLLGASLSLRRLTSHA